MSEDIYFDASRKFREPRKFKKSSYKPKGKEYKYIDPAESLIQQVETNIVKPKRMKKVKKDSEPLEKRLTDILEKRRQYRKGREVGKTVEPEKLKEIEALKERAIVPSVKMEMEKAEKEKQKKLDEEKLLQEGKHTQLIESLKDIYELPFIEQLYPNARPAVVQQKLESIGMDANNKLRTSMDKFLTDKGEPYTANILFNPIRDASESDEAYRDRARTAIRLYNQYRNEKGKGFTGGKLANMHPHLGGALIAHHYINQNADKIMATLPAKHKGIKELEQLKKNAKRGVIMSNKMYGKGFGDFFKKMVNAGKTVADVYKNIPDTIKKPIIQKGKQAGAEAVASLLKTIPIKK